MQRPRLPSTQQRLAARKLYGPDPEGYEAGRPEYPERIFDVLTARCGLRRGVAVLEIGPGTGRVTRRLTAMGAKVTAVEPDHALASHLRGVLADSEVQVVEDTFESAVLPPNQFDLAVAAMSFHWVHQETGLPKVRQVVRPGGWAAASSASARAPLRRISATCSSDWWSDRGPSSQAVPCVRDGSTCRRESGNVNPDRGPQHRAALTAAVGR